MLTLDQTRRIFGSPPPNEMQISIDAHRPITVLKRRHRSWEMPQELDCLRATAKVRVSAHAGYPDFILLDGAFRHENIALWLMHDDFDLHVHIGTHNAHLPFKPFWCQS